MAPKGLKGSVSSRKRKCAVSAGGGGGSEPPSGGSTAVAFDGDLDGSRKNRRLRRRDSDDRVDRIILRKLKVHFTDAAIEGSPLN